MRLTRRALVRLAIAAPVGMVLTRVADDAVTAAGRVATALRPPTAGTSATRCALCGAADHTMLDPRCPAARRVI